MLRIILCFLVVYRHTYTGERTFLVGYLYALSTSAVPVFMMLSFYLTAKHIERWDWSYVCERNVRLMIPMWGGAIVSFGLLYPIVDMDIKNLLFQFFCGKGVNGPLWFLCIMWVMTNLFFAMSYFLKQKYIYAVYILLGISLLLQYTGLNFYVFKNISGEIRGSYGTMMEVVPYACLGILCWKHNLIEPLKEKRYLNLLIIMIVFVEFFIKGSIFNIEHFGYGGINLIVVSCAVFLFAYIFPLQWIPFKINIFLGKAAEYTLGIYWTHLVVLHWMKKILEYTDCEMPYYILLTLLIFICISLSVLLDKIPNRYCKMLVK